MTRCTLVSVLMASVLLACSSAQSDWQKANAAGTVAAYQDFLNLHASDAHAAEARNRIQVLQDEQAWTQAQSANTVESLRKYLQSEPKGKHAQEARDQVAALERAADWKIAQANGSSAALQGFLQKYPQGPEADEARAQLRKLDAYQVQLAAFASKKAAEQTRAKLSARYSKVLQQLVVVSSGSSSKPDSVRSAPMSLADAQSTCATLHKFGQHCEVVKVIATGAGASSHHA